MRQRLDDLVEPLRHAAFRRLWWSGLLSQLGDWAARLALSVLVYDRTASAFASAAALGVSLLPWLGPGQWITARTEGLPRRRVMVASDLLRAGVFALATLGLPVPVLFALIFVSGLATPPFQAARAAIAPELLPRPVFASSLALTGMTDDLTLVGGYLLGGGVLALIGPQGALLLNATTFVASAALLAGLPGLRATADPAGGAGAAGRLRTAGLAILRTPYLRRAALLVTVALAAADTLIVLAVPRVVGELHADPTLVSWCVALACVVTIGGTAVLTHRSEPGRLLRAAAVLTLAGGLGAAASLALVPGAVGLTLAFAVSGLLPVVMVPANIVVCTHLPEQIRASALSILMGSLYGAQALVPMVAGALADLIGVVATGTIGLLAAAAYGGYALLRPVAVTTTTDHDPDDDADLTTDVLVAAPAGAR